MKCSECEKELDRDDRWIVPALRRKSQCSKKCAKKAWDKLGLPKPRMGQPKYIHLPIPPTCTVSPDVIDRR